MKIFLIVLFCCSLSLYAQAQGSLALGQKGVIIYKAPEINNNITGYIDSTELFFCDTIANKEWYKILQFKWKNQEQLSGYVMKKSVRIIEQMPLRQQKEIIQAILLQHRKNIISKSKVARLYQETHYTPILKVLPQYYCNTKDTITMQLLIDVMLREQGSADETPSYAIAQCFTCDTQNIIFLLDKLRSDEKQFLVNSIEFGLSNIFNIGEDEVTNNQEYLKLKNSLKTK